MFKIFQKYQQARGFTPLDSKNLTGFTLTESLIAISILLIGILSGFILVTRSLAQALVIQDRLTANYLAQEGIELVRQIRDTNFINQQPWNSGLSPGNYRISAETSLPVLLPDAEMFLKYDNNSGIFGYMLGTDTPFKRKIMIEPISNRQIRVQSIINWQTRRINYEIITESHLFDWLSP